MKTGLKAAALCVLAIVAFSCNKDKEPEKPADKIELAAYTMELGARGGSATLSLTANADWTASSDAAWATVSPARGKGSDQPQEVLIKAAANTGDAARAAVITFKISEDVHKELIVSQPKAEDNPGPDTPPSSEKIPAPVPTVKLAGPDWLIFRWDLSDNPFCTNYEIALYKGELLLRGKKVSDFTYGERFTNPVYLYDSAIVFGALDSNSEYVFKVRALSSDESVMPSSDWAEITGTTGAPFVETETDAILVERFNKMVFSGDYVNRAWGFRPTDAEAKTQASLWEPASMVQTPDGTTGDYFNTSSYPKTYRENIMGLAGWEGSKVYGHFGFPKLGTSSAAGYLTTCPLDKISGKKNLVVKFKCMPFCELREEAVSDPLSVAVDVLDAGAADAGTIELTAGAGKWTECEFHIKDATAQTRVSFKTTGAAKCRVLIDDIVIKEYAGAIDIHDEAPAAVRMVASHTTDLAFEWDAPSDNVNRTFNVYLYESATGEPVRSYTVAFDTKFHRNAFTFAALAPSTTYWLGVQSKTSEIVKIEAKTADVIQVPDDIIFWAPFDECRWGGDHVNNTYGAKPAVTDKTADPLAEMNTVQTPNGGGSGNMFGTMSAAWKEQRGLADWPSGTACYEYPGYFKFGAASSAGTVALPALTKIGATPKDVILSFDASPWVEPNNDPTKNVSDKTNALISIKSGPGTLYQDGNAVSGEAVINIEALPQRVWTPLSFRIEGATQETVILFNSINNSDNSGNKCRWCIDNIKVELVK